MIRTVFIVFFSVLLAACSPEYNWREVRLGNGAVTALFPDKPATQERVLDFSGHDIRFSLTTASVNKALFAVGVAPLMPALQSNVAESEALAAGMIRSLYLKLGAPVPSLLPALGESFMIQGSAPGGDVRLQAKVWLSKYALVEAAVTAEVSEFPEAQAEEFLRGLVLAQ